MHSSRKNILIKFLVCRYRSLSALYIGLLKKHRKINPLPSIFLDKFFRRNSDPLLAACEHIPCIFQIPSLIQWQKIICIEPSFLKNRIKNPFRTVVRKGSYDLTVRPNILVNFLKLHRTLTLLSKTHFSISLYIPFLTKQPKIVVKV